MMQRHQENQEFQPGEPGYISPDSTPKRSVLDKIKLFHQKVSDSEETNQPSKKWEVSKKAENSSGNKASRSKETSASCQVAVTCVEAREVPLLPGDPLPNSCCRVSLIAPGIEPVSSDTKIVRGSVSPKWKERLIFGIEEDLVKWTCIRIELVGVSENGETVNHGKIRLIHVSELQDQAWVAGWFELYDEDENPVGKSAIRVTIRFNRQQAKESVNMPVVSSKEVTDPSSENSGGGSPYSCSSDVSKSPSGPKTQFSSRGSQPAYPSLTSSAADRDGQEPAGEMNDFGTPKNHKLPCKSDADECQANLTDERTPSPRPHRANLNSKEAKHTPSKQISPKQRNVEIDSDSNKKDLSRSPFQLLKNVWEVDSEDEDESHQLEGKDKFATCESNLQATHGQLEGYKSHSQAPERSEADSILSSQKSSQNIGSVGDFASSSKLYAHSASSGKQAPPSTPTNFQTSSTKEVVGGQDGAADAGQVRGQTESSGPSSAETRRMPWAQREQIRRLKSQVAQLQARLLEKEQELTVEREKSGQAEERAKAIESHRDKENDKDVNYIRRLQQEVQAERALRLSAENMLKQANRKIESLDKIINENVQAWMMLEAAVCEKISNTREGTASEAFSTPSVVKLSSVCFSDLVFDM